MTSVAATKSGTLANPRIRPGSKQRRKRMNASAVNARRSG
jgi:hypothetical protein